MSQRFLCKVLGSDGQAKVLRLNKGRVKTGEQDVFPKWPKMNRVEALRLIRREFKVLTEEKD